MLVLLWPGQGGIEFKRELQGGHLPMLAHPKKCANPPHGIQLPAT